MASYIQTYCSQIDINIHEQLLLKYHLKIHQLSPELKLQPQSKVMFQINSKTLEEAKTAKLYLDEIDQAVGYNITLGKTEATENQNSTLRVDTITNDFLTLLQKNFERFGKDLMPTGVGRLTYARIIEYPALTPKSQQFLYTVQAICFSVGIFTVLVLKNIMQLLRD